MILPSFTREEILAEFKHVSSLFEERANSFYSYNSKVINKKLAKSGLYFKVFSCELKHQRYYERIDYILEGKDIHLQRRSIFTVFKDELGVFVLVHSPIRSFSEDVYIKSSMELRVLSAHFLNRYIERTGKAEAAKDLIDKVLIFLVESQGLSASTVDDDVIRRYGEPTLPYVFLSEGAKETECTYTGDGDIAIIERYGLVPVWRTYITKEMLFQTQADYINRQKIQEGIQFAKDVSEILKPR